jgi:DNA invertase Pin-like site-specific DNA recombinase
VVRAILVVAIYCRYSVNPDDKSESTETQVKRGRAEAEKRWPGCVVRVYADDNYSGTTDDRPEYQRLLADIRRGEIDKVFAKDQSRIARDTQVWDRFRVTSLAGGVEELDCWVGASSSHVAGKSLPGRMMALIDAEYVEKTRQAVLDHLAMYASEGRAPGGVCLGYTRGLVTVTIGEATTTIKTLIPDERWVPLIQEAFESVLVGGKVSTITEQFNDAGIPTPRNGKLWRPSNLSRLLRSPTLTALRMHVTEAKRRDLKAEGVHFVTLKVAKEHGNVYEGLWEPIIERQLFLDVQRLLDEPGTVIKSNGQIARRGIKRGPVAVHLLSGIARCGKPPCRSTLTGTTRKNRPALYVCHSTNGGCNGIGINMDDANREAERQFLEHLNSEEYRNGLNAADPHADERIALANKIGRIDLEREQDAEEQLSGEMTREEYKMRGAKAAELRAGHIAKLETLPQYVGEIDPDALLLAWGEAELVEKRRILMLAVDYVEIRPATQMGVFDPGRVKVHMRTWW